jgi:hypothetical protein
MLMEQVILMSLKADIESFKASIGELERIAKSFVVKGNVSVLAKRVL